MVIWMLEKGRGEDLAKFFSIARSLWSRRNHMVYESKRDTPLEAFEKAMSVVTIHQSILTESSPKSKTLKWEPPPINSFKLNVDRAIVFNLHKAGVGFIIWDHSSMAIMATNIVERNVANPKSIETLAILRSLQLCLHQGIPNVMKVIFFAGGGDFITRCTQLSAWNYPFEN